MFRSQTDSAVILPKQFKQETRQTKYRFLKKEFNDTSSLLNQGKLYTEHFNEFKSYYDTSLYVHDFDLDGDYDILFFGRPCRGSETHQVILYFKNGSKYIPQQMGNWLVGMKATRRVTEIAVLNPPCCAGGIQLEFMYYEAVDGLRDSLRQFSHQIFGLDAFESKLPEKIDTLISFTKPVTMFNRPDNTDEDKQFYLETEQSPIIGIISPGTVLQAYNVFEFQGKRWFYIIAKVGAEIQLSEEWNHSFNGEIKAARGWICLE